MRQFAKFNARTGELHLIELNSKIQQSFTLGASQADADHINSENDNSEAVLKHVFTCDLSSEYEYDKIWEL